MLAWSVRADNPCMEGGPYTTMVSTTPGTFLPGVFTPTNVNALVGQWVAPPVAYGYAMTPGYELDYISFDCPKSGGNHYVNNMITYTLGSVCYVPPFPGTFQAPGTYIYTGEVVATGSSGSLITNILGTVTVNVTGRPAPLVLDVAFGSAAATGKVGLAATGLTTNDFWNYFSTQDDTQSSGSLVNLGSTYGATTAVGLNIANVTGTSGNGASDLMYQTFLYSGSGISLTVANLPAGQYNFYLYGHGNVNNESGVFQLSSGSLNYGTSATASTGTGWQSSAWQLGQQYVEFTNVVVVNNQPVTINVLKDAGGYAVLSGMQIAQVGASAPAPSTGLVVAWGDNTYGQCNVPSGLSNVVAVSAGARHSLALKGDGTVVAWGADDYGQASVPAGLANVVAISAGDCNSLALKNDGTVVGWGTAVAVPTGLANVMAVDI